jgi:hypothetical protein
VLDGKPLQPEELCINAHGLENVKGLRGLNDGIIHFGSKKFTSLDKLDEIERQLV